MSPKPKKKRKRSPKGSSGGLRGLAAASPATRKKVSSKGGKAGGHRYNRRQARTARHWQEILIHQGKMARQPFIEETKAKAKRRKDPNQS